MAGASVRPPRPVVASHAWTLVGLPCRKRRRKKTRVTVRDSSSNPLQTSYLCVFLSRLLEGSLSSSHEDDIITRRLWCVTSKEKVPLIVTDILEQNDSNLWFGDDQLPSLNRVN